ncbi:hypothetical protein WT94_01055 [Burkholderia stagnalis]|nr:hypothetical protein WT76_15895 [Burkholderia stagnalis]KWO26742.1 hypothetical protein WT94_01055 [Burkholderia stagnalis]
MHTARVERARHLREHRAAIQAARRAGRPRFVAVGRPAASSHRPFSFDRSDGASLGVGALEREADPGPPIPRALSNSMLAMRTRSRNHSTWRMRCTARATGAGSRRTHTYAHPPQRRWPVR